MRKYNLVYKFIFFFFFFIFYGHAQTPALKFIHPKGTVSKNHVRINIQSHRKDIAFISLYAEYQDEVTITQDWYSHKLFLGSDSAAPYEWLWKCDSILDGSIVLVALPFQKNNEPMNEYSETRRFILDRKKDIPTIVLKSMYWNKPITIDANSDDWPIKDSLLFENDDNVITVQSVWNRDFLCFFIDVRDQYLFADTLSHKGQVVPYYHMDSGMVESKTDTVRQLFNYDEVELCFDTKNNRGSYRQRDDVDILISPLGKFQGNFSFYDSSGTLRLMLWQNNVKLESATFGTINDNSDLDTGFVVETAIPWKDLDIQPKENLKIGFDMVNVDRDGPASKKFFISFCRSTWLTNDNPSEWGTLVLVGKRPRKLLISIIIIGAVILILVFTIMLKGRSSSEQNREGEGDLSKKYERRIEKAVMFIRQNLSQPLLSEDVAKAVGLSEAHFRKLFLKETGETFGQFLIKVRIEESKRLLLKGDMNISEIAYACGFNSSQYFATTFHKVVGMSPQEFKKKHSYV